MKGIIAAVSPEGVIGIDGKIPWRYPADLARFKRLTLDSTVIMGRATYESIGRPLPRRRNMVITRSDIAGVECFRDIASALKAASEPLWFIGGARIYEEALAYADTIDLTYVPDSIAREDAVRMPTIDAALWEAGPLVVHEDDERLKRQVFTRRQ